MAEPIREPAPGDSRNLPAPPDEEIEITGFDGAASTDDTPTVISKRGPRPPTADALTDRPGDGLRGRRLAHFELIEPIGVGGMAAVLRARDTQLDRFVALKILPPDMAQDPENVRRFHQEARSAAKLDHENIARVFFCGEDQRLHFIAFEFVEGENLRTLLERRGRLPASEALHYMLQIAAGLAHAARRGVVHRDIKPSNIIVTPNGRAKLVDMGLARSLDPQPDKGLTQSGVTLGTFDYISPEQALEPRDADVRSDIYSLGCTFYHVLTGHPPVPEGTAAKKLHHHQHVRPPDPRQFVPDLPDDVAVILDRMMAKRPADRYQSPEQLVHHLLLAARKLGASPEVPEGVLSVEAALPNPPRGRPLLLVALAAAAVVGLIFLLDQSPPPPPSPRPAPGAGAQSSGKDQGPGPAVGHPREATNADKGPPATRPGPPAPAPAVYEAASAQGLADWLKLHEEDPRVEIVLDQDIDLSPRLGDGDRGEQGLVLRNKQQVTIRARDRGRRPTVRFRYDGRTANKGKRAALTFAGCKEVTLDGLRFVLDLCEAHADMVGVLFRGGGKHTVRRCEFIQAQPTFDPISRLASVVAEEGRSRPSLLLRECCFLGFQELSEKPDRGPGALVLARADRGGQDAVVRRGAVAVTAVNCAFGPHLATFRLEGSPEEERGAVALEHCSVLAARRSALFDVPAGATAALQARATLVARPGEGGLPGMAEGEGAVLIRQADVRGVSYQGRDNRYYNLDGYWVAGDSRDDTAWKDFQDKLRATRGEDAGSQELSGNPWQEKEEAQFKLLEEQRFLAAFQVRERAPELRVREKGDDHLVGAEQVLGLAYAPSGRLPPAEVKRPDGAGRERVVDPDANDSSKGLYASLPAAVLDARPGDVILIRSNKALAVDPIKLNKKGLAHLTIQPHPGFRPTLVLAPTDRESALFTVYGGKLLLENLELRLEPGKNESTSQAVVVLAGDGDCTLRGCLVTLDKGGGDTALALAALPEAGKVMKADMAPARTRDQGPHLALERCVVRGDGDLLVGRAGRPFEVEAKNVLAALGGSVLNLDGTGDAAAVGASQKAAVRLTQVTTYLGGPLLHLSLGKDLKGVVPVQVRPQDCLFVPAPGAQPLVKLEGTEEKALSRKLTWDGGRNAYGAGYTSFVEQQPPGEAMMLPPLNREGWKAFTGETASKFGAELASPPPPEGPFAQLAPGQLKPADDLSGFGADADELSRLLRRGAAVAP